MNVALGSVQFGLNYGLTNSSGKVSFSEVKKIINFALTKNIQIIDTAMSYGDSEHILGRVGVSKFDLITKISNTQNSDFHSYQNFKSQVNNSINHLKVSRLYGLLFHNALDILTSKGERIYNHCINLKEEGLIENIGISIYDPDELEKIDLDKYKINIVQGPLNLFDDRISSSGWLKKLNSRNIKFHARSVFLQGLLLQKKINRDMYFNQWEKHFSKYDDFVKNSGYSELTLAINYIFSHKEVDQIIIGVQNLEQLIQVVNIFENPININFPNFLSINDKKLINPSLWKIAS